MVFKLYLILDFWALKPCVPVHMVSNSIQLLIFELWNLCALACMLFKLFSTLDYQAWFQDLFYLTIVFKLSNVFNECNCWFFYRMMLLPHIFLNQQHLWLMKLMLIIGWLTILKNQRNSKPTHHLLMLNKHVFLKRNKI